MKDREPTLESLALGSALAGAMMSAGLNQVELAYQLGKSPSYVSRIISGKRADMPGISWRGSIDVA
jgi:transcriptional regulator with XRE-family HTH domain